MAKKFHKNPRKISKVKLEQLRKSLVKLGDLGGIVHDLNSDEIISGNQRDSIIEIDKCEIEIVKQFEKPDEQGTVAIGFVVWQGKSYSYRQVRWSPELCDEANILANLAGGGWDMSMLENFNVPSLIEWGFDTDLQKQLKEELDGIDELLENEKSEEEIEEETEAIKPREMARVLISVPVDSAIDVKSILDTLQEIDGIEIIYGAN